MERSYVSISAFHLRNEWTRFGEKQHLAITVRADEFIFDA
jgi:hypothetical protein